MVSKITDREWYGKNIDQRLETMVSSFRAETDDRFDKIETHLSSLSTSSLGDATRQKFPQFIQIYAGKKIWKD